MALDQCLQNAVAGGEITPGEANELNRQFNRYFKGLKKKGSIAAAPEAKREVIFRLIAEAKEKKRRALLSALALKRIKGDLDNFRNLRGEKDIGEAAIALLEHYGTAPFASVEGRRKALTGRAHAMMGDVLARFERTKLSGRTPHKAELENLVREAFGEDSGDAGAKAFARAWLDTAEWLRARFNKAGGAIGKLADWGMPQTHKRKALKRAGRETWKDYIRPKLDASRMKHPLTGKPVLEAELDDILDEIFSTIVSDGWTKREAKLQPQGKGAIAKQHAEHRFLVFRDADAWLAYQRDFGEGNPFSAMMNHINLMARDVAATEILGPNPAMTVEYLKQRISKEAATKSAGLPADFAGRGDPESRGNRKAQLVGNMWADMRGNLETPVSTGAADVLSGTRNFIVSSVLGQAFLSAFTTDTMYQTIARKYVGLPAMGTFRQIVKTFRKGDRMMAVRAGLILDSAQHTLTTNARYMGTFTGPGWTRWLADRVLALSWLTPWTQAGRHSFGLEFMGALADHAKHSFDDLDPVFRSFFERYGLGAAEWDTIRAIRPHEDRGATFIRPQDIAGVDEKVAERVLEMILQEQEYAVPSSTVRGHATFFEGNQPGTFWGEVIRSGAMFKSFAVTFAYLQGMRTAQTVHSSGALAGAGYAGAVAITTTLGGALSLWMKDVANGRDPRPIAGPDGNPLKFFTAAFMQGGGIGIFGDFLFSDLNRYGGGFASTIAGPMVQRASDLWNLTAGNAVQFATGEDTKFLEEARRFAGRMTPGGTLWYLNLAYKRVFLDQLQHLTDPKANSSFKRKQRRYLKDFGADHWWKPGAAAPARGPEFDVLR